MPDAERLSGKAHERQQDRPRDQKNRERRGDDRSGHGEHDEEQQKKQERWDTHVHHVAASNLLMFLRKLRLVALHVPHRNPYEVVFKTLVPGGVITPWIPHLETLVAAMVESAREARKCVEGGEMGRVRGYAGDIETIRLHLAVSGELRVLLELGMCGGKQRGGNGGGDEGMEGEETKREMKMKTKREEQNWGWSSEKYEEVFGRVWKEDQEFLLKDGFERRLLDMAEKLE
ncbi:hypothetical protein MKZ38_010228 [Zalerion maritima]|uniref:Uncharacterized protein n=1 Tax=Zalerion maritima TaxID=339359 RepID=A0AAD5S0S8_9PEZI|nr:hypothetical protein MKZ38_010228 [Zalerion maritima]